MPCTNRIRTVRGRFPSGTTGPLPWAPTLGPRPADPAAQTAWLDAATAVTAYRERYDLPDHTPMLGARPVRSRPDARAAWDYARLQADRYLARRLRDLDGQTLADLDARQQAILDSPPPFDPAQLERARQRSDAARATGDPHLRPASPEQLLVQRLERAAQTHRHWRGASTDAQDLRRQIALEQRRRRSPRVRTWRPFGLGEEGLRPEISVCRNLVALASEATTPGHWQGADGA